MKNKLAYLIILPLFIACGGGATVDDLIANGDVDAIATKKTQLLNQKKELEDQITTIEKYLDDNVIKREGALVTATVVNDTLFKHYIELQGSVDTKQNITITAESAGILTDIFVTEGERVVKGQKLAKIDDGGLSQQIEQMKVQAQLAKTTFERQKRLWDQNIGSEIQYLQSKANYESQQNAINSMQQQLAKSVVRAPFSGVIDDVITEQGNVASPGMTPLFRIVNLSDMYIEVEVPETYITAIQEGTTVDINFPVLGEQMQSKVRQSSSFINPANRSFKIEVPVANQTGNVKPNLTARIKINDYTSENAILLPLSVLSENQNGEQYIMVATNVEEGDNYKTATAKKRFIKAGKTSDNKIEILDGVQAGDLVIVEGARSVKEDQQVRIKA